MTATAVLRPARTQAPEFCPAALRAARKAAGLTLGQVGTHLARHGVTVARYEGGAIDPPASVLGALAALYGVGVGDFYRVP